MQIHEGRRDMSKDACKPESSFWSPRRRGLSIHDVVSEPLALRGWTPLSLGRVAWTRSLRG